MANLNTKSYWLKMETIYLDGKPVKASALLADNPGNDELAEAVAEVLSGSACVKIGGGASAEFIVSRPTRGMAKVIISNIGNGR